MLKNIIKITLLLTLFWSLFLSVNKSIAQGIPTSLDQVMGIELIVSPESPKPNQDISISVSSYSINLDSSTIRWYIDDKIKKEGVGEKVFNTKVGNSGESITITVEVNTYDGRIFNQATTINPAEIDLIIESNSYTPPLYKGRPYFVSQGQAKIIAIPNIVQDSKKLEVKDLSFRWEKDGVVLGSQSGTGKNTLTIEGSIPIRDVNINLTVFNSSKKILATESAFINPNKPQILFYEDSSLYGVLLNKALSGDYNIGNKEEVKVIAFPYFFNTSSVNSTELRYKWSVNGKSVTLSGKKNELILRQDGKTSGGTASVSLTIENLVRIFQYDTYNFNLIFGK